MLDQLVHHLHSNKLIPHHHHGGFNQKSTVTALTTLIDTWANCLESGEDAIAIAMDQSKAFDIVDHQLLIKKLKLLGLDYHSLQLMTSYLADRTQVVYLEGSTSSTLHTGPRSVIQGSGLSCTLYLVYTMDLPLIFETTAKTIRQSEASTQPESLTYVDDNFITIRQKANELLQHTILNTIQLVETYMAANLLMLNPEKTKIMVLSRHPANRNKYFIPAVPKYIHHSKHLKVLGIDISYDLNWKFFLLDGKMSSWSSGSMH